MIARMLEEIRTLLICNFDKMKKSAKNIQITPLYLRKFHFPPCVLMPILVYYHKQCVSISTEDVLRVASSRVAWLADDVKEGDSQLCVDTSVVWKRCYTEKHTLPRREARSHRHKRWHSVLMPLMMAAKTAATPSISLIAVSLASMPETVSRTPRHFIAVRRSLKWGV